MLKITSRKNAISVSDLNYVSFLENQEKKRPDAVAYRLADNQRALKQEITYEELNEKAQHPARLVRRHAKIGDRALLMIYDTHIHFIILLYSPIFMLALLLLFQLIR